MPDQRFEIFTRLKGLIKEYEGPFTPKTDRKDMYDLWSFKDVEIAGRQRKEVFFASIVIRKKYVGFYFMPVYADTELKEVFEPELLSLLKGKSCFHVQELDDNLEQQIKKALEIGFDLYKKREWV